MAGAAVALLLGVSGCTAGESTPAYLPSEGESAQVAIPVVDVTLEASPSPSEVMVRGLDGEPKPRASAETIAPDAAVLATMECEPVSRELLDRKRIDFGAPRRSVQVEVGEGLTPGETWWVVILDSPSDEAHKEGLRPFLTNAPGPGGADEWISLRGLKRVAWDSERLVRAQSALTKAEECLGGS